MASTVTLITFEELPGGLSAMANALTVVPASSRLTTQYHATYGVRFTSTAGFAALVNHGPGKPTASEPNIIGGTSASGVLNYDEWITISFFDPANTSQKATTDFFEIQGDWIPLGTGSVYAEAFDVNGVLLASTSAPDVGPIGTGALLSLSVSGMHAVRVRGDNGTVGFDNLRFNTLVPVPEPSAAALAMGTLIALVSWRRSVRRVAAARA